MSNVLLYELNSAVAVLTINDAPYNRMSLEFMDELEAKVAEIAANKQIRSVLLTGLALKTSQLG